MHLWRRLGIAQVNLVSALALHKRSGLLLSLGGLVYEVHKLVELGRDDDLRAAVALATFLGGVVGKGIVLAATSSREALGVYAVLVLQGLNHRRSAEGREVPVVADVFLRNGHVVGIAFHEDVVVLIVGDDLGNLGERFARAVTDFVAAALVEHVVGEGNVDHAFKHLHVHVVHLFAREGTGEFVGEGLVEGVALRLGVNELLDELIGGIDFVDKFRDIHIALRHVFCVGGLEFAVGGLQVAVALLLVGKAGGEAFGIGGEGSYLYLCFLIVFVERGVFVFKGVVRGLQFGILLFADAAGKHERDGCDKDCFACFHF